MPRQTYTNIQVPEGPDSVTPLAGLFEALANSARVIIPASGPTPMEQVRTAAVAAGFGPTAARPLYVHRTDEDCLYRHTGSGGWVRMTPRRSPQAVYATRETVTIPAGESQTSVTIPFAPGLFTSTPRIATSSSVRRDIWAPNSTTSPSGATVWVATVDGSAAPSGGMTSAVDIIAVQY